MTEDRRREDALPTTPIADRVRDLLHDVPDLARLAMDDARDLGRRATMAVARTAGDGGALPLLACGAAAAALSWIALRARGRGRGR